MIAISDKQEEMLAFIENFVSHKGYSPTYEEIKTGLSISSKSLVNYHLDVLENAQLLSRAANTPRSIQLKNGQQATQLSFANVTKENAPANALQLDHADMLELTFGAVAETNGLCALKIEDDTVATTFADHGDVVIFKNQKHAQNGEVVAVKLPTQKEILFQRYFRENGHVRLQSPDKTLVELFVMPEAVEIQGKVVAVIRQVN